MIAVDVLDVDERGHEWVDSNGLRWRYSDGAGWQWFAPWDQQKWVTSNRPKIQARGPFMQLAD